MPLTAQQNESWQLAIIGLFLMTLSTLFVHALFTFRHRGTSNKPPLGAGEMSEFELLAGIVIVFLWIGAFLEWSFCLGAVSRSLRNAALLYGVVAANGGVVYVLLRWEGASPHLYMAFTLWPMYLGMLLGSFSIFT